MTTTTKTLEHSSEQLMEQIVDPDNLLGALSRFFFAFVAVNVTTAVRSVRELRGTCVALTVEPCNVWNDRPILQSCLAN